MLSVSELAPSPAPIGRGPAMRPAGMAGAVPAAWVLALPAQHPDGSLWEGRAQCFSEGCKRGHAEFADGFGKPDGYISP